MTQHNTTQKKNMVSNKDNESGRAYALWPRPFLLMHALKEADFWYLSTKMRS